MCVLIKGGISRIHIDIMKIIVKCTIEKCFELMVLGLFGYLVIW